ncbi:hypothetical protein CEP54_002626 [Fusarium duplospermum]|uniref:Uncharacterized protein n=1 Tax=Fusarium duplospermum TaxID=1325734 RepID=A0A428QTN5_9HYPO|nr:hypothetical protein CEP54_002626 [Fusarium duplospermum]
MHNNGHILVPGVPGQNGTRKGFKKPRFTQPFLQLRGQWNNALERDAKATSQATVEQQEFGQFMLSETRKALDEQKAFVKQQRSMINDQQFMINDQQFMIKDQQSTIRCQKASLRRLQQTPTAQREPSQLAQSDPHHSEEEEESDDTSGSESSLEDDCDRVLKRETSGGH